MGHVEWDALPGSPIEAIEREARRLRSMPRPVFLPVGRRAAHAIYEARCRVDLRRCPRLTDALWKVARHA